jgi:hypothetical protein
MCVANSVTDISWFIFLCKTNNSYSSEGRYREFYNDPAMSLIRYSSFLFLDNLRSVIEEYFQLPGLCYLSVRNSDVIF